MESFSSRDLSEGKYVELIMILILMVFGGDLLY